MELQTRTYAYRSSLCVAGAGGAIFTDSLPVLDALRNWNTAAADVAPSFTLTVDCGTFSPQLTPTQFRGMEHFVLARYGENIFLFDLLRHSVNAFLSEAVASDPAFWDHRIIPLILGVLGTAIGVLPMHSACVVKDGQGILIAGASMAGKSTLSLALSQRGFSLLSDDWIYIRRRPEGLVVHGVDAPVKLLADAPAHFPQLRQWTAAPTANGEIGYELQPSHLGLTPARKCVPVLIVFLERICSGASHFVQVRRRYVEQYLNNSVERLPKSLPHLSDKRRSLVTSVSHLPALRFRYAGTPHHGAELMASFVQKTLEVSR